MNRQQCVGFLLIILSVLLGLSKQQVKADIFPLSIIHINDFHARFEATDTSGGTCEDDEICIGGYARTVYTVKRLLEEQKDTNAVYFNAGDSFQGTLWYNVGRWNVTSQFLNMLPADAMTLGNHEFDHGVEGAIPFLETLNTTMLVANMDSTNEPDMTGKYQNSMIIERSNRKIGVIGVILETTYDLANTGNLIFRNESDTIVEEAAKLKAQGANIIIVISHCGYDVDKEIAENAGSEIDVIIGSHSHTFLYTGDNPPGPDTPRGDYPTQITHASGHRVLIVQASAYAKYVGNITVYFDDDGNVVDFEGAPIYMGADVPEDPEVVEAMKPWKEDVDIQGKVIVGVTVVDLLKYPCSYTECNLGNYFCDAMTYAFARLAPYEESAWSNVPIGLVNTGALRVPLSRGNLSYSHLVSMSPFENVLTAFDLPGERLLEALEFSASKIDYDNGVTSSYIFLQVSGLKVTYDFTKPMYERVVDLKVRCSACIYPQYEPFNITSTYRVATPNFLQDGGDGYYMFRDYGTNIQPYVTDLDALLDYTAAATPIYNDPTVIEELQPWKLVLDAQISEIIGESKVDLTKDSCYSMECSVGNFFADAIVYAFTKLTPYKEQYWTQAAIALVNSGAIRASLFKGNLTYGHLATMSPFENKLTAFTLPGHQLVQALEFSLKDIDLSAGKLSSQKFLQVSGLKITYNFTKPYGERLQDIMVRCQKCMTPAYLPMKLEENYRIITSDFIAEGGGGFTMFRDYGTDLKKEMTDLEAICDYVKENQPILTGVENRITVIN